MTDDKLRERLLAERIARELARSDGIPDDASTGDYLRNTRDLLAAMPELTRKSAIADQLAILEPASDWTEKRDELLGWTGSAFLAGEKVDDELQCKADLYAFLCSLIGYLTTAESSAQALATYRESRHEA